MSKTSLPKQHQVPTTNFIIDVEKIDTKLLTQKYKLFTLEIPSKFSFLKDYHKFAKLHNTYKENLEYPYYYFSHADPKPCIYILVEQQKYENQSINLTFDFLDNEKVIAHEMDIKDLCTDENLPILAKLFLSSWFYKKHRTCQGDFFYIHSTDDKSKTTALNVKIQRSKNKGEFEINAQSSYLDCLERINEKNIDYLLKENGHLNKPNAHSYIFLEKLIGELYYKQIKKSEIVKRLEKAKLELSKNSDKKPASLLHIFKEFDNQNKKPEWYKKSAIKWYENGENFKNSRTELLRNFLIDLVEHYNENLGGDCAKRQYHEMKEIKPVKHSIIKGYVGKTGLYLKMLGEIGVYDNRFKNISQENKNHFQEYIDFLNKYYGNLYFVKFVQITKSELNSTNKAILVFQDVDKKIFKEGMLLDGHDDPKETLYNELSKKIALQTMSINTNTFNEGFTLENYFQYEVIGKKLLALGNSLEEINNNLKKEEKELKDIRNKEKKEFKELSEKTKERGKIHKELKNHHSLITNKITVCLNELLLKYYLINELPIKCKVKKTNLVLSDKDIKEEEDLSLPNVSDNESLTNFSYMYKNFFMYVDNDFVLRFYDLHNFEGKDKRNNFLENLGVNWNQIDNDFAERNYTRKDGKNKMYKKYDQWKDTHEERMKNTHFVFSKDLVLAIEDTEERVLFKTEVAKKHPSQRILETKTALENVYYSKEEEIYTVGEQSMNQNMDKSVKVRRLHYYQKPVDFEPSNLLQTLAVEFVRNKQYTVYPYFFDLLNLYRKDILLSEQTV